MLQRPRRLIIGGLAALAPLLLIGFGITAVAESPSPGASASPAASGSPAPGGSPAASGSPAAGASPGGSPGAGLPGDPTKGAQLYSSAGCTGCHGASLEGGVGKRLNPIDGGASRLQPDFLIKTISQGVPGTAMQPWAGKLADQDIKDVAAFIIQSNKAGKPAIGPVELARSNVFWVGMGIIGMSLVTWLLARYNMRWVARRAQARSRLR